jgi:hypothetical protein
VAPARPEPRRERFDGPVLGLYQLRDGRLARAQMFHFDTVALAGFLASATRQAATPEPEAAGPPSGVLSARSIGPSMRRRP